MTIKLLLLTYVLGGITFLPLLAISAFLILYYSSPAARQTGDVAQDVKGSKERADSGADTPAEGAASATFAVLRRYDFQAATTALKDANTAAEKAEAAVDGQNAEGVSVYQSMYRTVFDRNRNAANPLQDTEEAATQKAKAKSAGRVFYIVLRHGHLMLYDSAVQFEVRHVISLAHYSISLEDDITSNAADFLESDVFTRRTAIVLTPQDKEAGKKPYYLFGDINIEKEDFYYALLSSIASPPIPRALDIESMIKLQSALHSNSLSQESRALDALLGRVFLALHRTPFLEAFVRHKIETKMARIPKPAFIASMACHALDLGNAAPILSNIRLKDINISGEIVLALDLKYTGGINLTISAAAKLDLGPRFKTRMVSLLLAVVLQRLQGKMLVKIKPPPSNRIWFCFETMPDMELKIEPVVSSRQITYSFVLRAIEARIREAFAEGLVKPNWDDVPFFATEEQRWRGGIWENETAQEAEQEAELGEVVADVHPLSQRNDKTSSMPVLSTGTDTEDLASVKRRSTANLLSQAAKTAAEKAATTAARAPKSMRSASFAPPAAVVALDDASADAVRADESITPTKRRWIGRNNQGPAQKRDAAEEMRQVRDRDTLGRKEETAEDSSVLEDELALEVDGDLPDSRRQSTKSADVISLSSGQPALLKSATASIVESNNDIAGRHLRGASTDSSANPQRKTILATTAAATAAARQWTWNAMQNRKNGQPIFRKQNTQSAEDLSAEDAKQQAQSNAKKAPLPAGPVGRGQPLPPPGKPLPGPTTKGLWSAAATGIGNMRRKQAPVLPPRSDAAMPPAQSPAKNDTNAGAPDLALQTATEQDQQHGHEGPQSGDTDGEFGPWMTNDFNDDMNLHAQPGTVDAPADATNPQEVADMTKSVSSPNKKKPPPLPRRPVNNHVAESKDDTEATALPNTDTSATALSEDPLIDLDEAGVSEAAQPSAHVPDLGSEALPEVVALERLEADTEREAVNDSLSDEEEFPALEDDIQAIPAPVDAEAEESGVLHLAEETAQVTQA